MEEKIAMYKKIDKNLYKLNLLINADELEKLRIKIYFAKEIAQYGYNIWVDYDEE